MKGLIALDIDGTITSDFHSVPEQVEQFFFELQKEGWQLAFLTGRSYAFAKKALKNFTFPYHLALINGATILEMPGEKLVVSNGLDPEIFPKLDAISPDYIIYGGYDQEDRCFYRPKHFSKEQLEYLLQRAKAFNETWEPVETFEIEKFSSIKYIAPRDVAQKIGKEVTEQLNIFIPVIRDPFREGYYVAQGTKRGVNKGETVQYLRTHLGNSGPLIVGGDDHNDSEMLASADVSVLMETAPKEMHPLADVIAKPASQQGIIEALKIAIRRVS